MKFRKLILTLLATLSVIAVFTLGASAVSAPDAPAVSISNILASGQNRLTWNSADGAKYYRIYRSETKSGGYELVKSTSSLSYTDSDAQPGEKFYYCIKSVSDEKKTSATSNKVSATVKLPRTTVTLSNVSTTGKISVNWTKVSGASEYEVYRATSKTGEFRLIKTTTATSMSNTSTTTGKRYYYKVVAVHTNTAANSAFSAAVSITCKLPRPVVTATADNVEATVKLSWDAVDGAKNYRIYRATSSSGEYTYLNPTTKTSYTDSTGTAGKTYYYKVIAVHADGANSAYSAAKKATFPQIEGLIVSVTLNGEDAPYLRWNTVSSAKSYKVYRSLYQDKNFSLISTRTVCNYTNPGAPEGLTVYYKVVALNSSGATIETSEVVSVTTKLSTEETLKSRYVSVPQVKIYSLPDTGSKAKNVVYMKRLQLGNAVITNDSATWYRVFYGGTLYYLRIANGENKLATKKSTFTYSAENELQQKVISLAADISLNWNTIYATGQSEGVQNIDGTYGFNAPGFVKYVLNTVMQEFVPTYKLSVTLSSIYSADYLYNKGYTNAFRVTDISRDNLLPGDVIFFGETSAEYCGIYLGNNEFAYCNYSSGKVTIMPLKDSFDEEYLCAKRYIPEEAKPVSKSMAVVGTYKTYKLYKEMSADSEVIAQIPLYGAVTLLYTNCDKWAYISTSDGTKGFIMLSNLGEYEYLDTISATVTLTDNKPYLTWNKVKNAEIYKVYRSLRNDSGFELLTTTNNTYYSNASAPEALTLYYKLEALDAAGEILDTCIVSIATPITGTETLKTVYVNLPVINLYELPDTNSEPVAIRYMEQLSLGKGIITRTDGTWYRVYYNNTLCYLWCENISRTLTETKSSFTYATDTVYQQKVLELAMEISNNWDTTYAHEQSNGIPDANNVYGFDCSGFVKYVFNTVMQNYVPTYKLSADLQTLHATIDIYNDGYPGAFNATDVDITDLQPGDVLFFTSLADGSSSTEIGHCGIYLGNNEFVHSTSSWEDAVCVMPISGSYLENFAGARRYLPYEVKAADTVRTIVGPFYTYNLYSERDASSTVIGTLSQYDNVTVLFTDNGNWAYVETQDGKRGYFRVEYFGDYEFLDYLMLNVELNSENKPYLSWNKISDAYKYEIYRSFSIDSEFKFISSTQNTYYTNASAQAGLTFYYKVKAVDAAGGEIDTSDAFAVTTPLASEETLLKRYVSVPQLKLYALPETTSETVTIGYMEELMLGAEVISSTTGTWSRVFYQNLLYYLWQGNSDESKLTETNSTSSYTGNTVYQQEVIDLALDFCFNKDTMYALGQSDGVPNAAGVYGFNAPGFVKYILNTVMQKYVPVYNLPVNLAALYDTQQIYNIGYSGELCTTAVRRELIQPGDVIFFGSGTTPSYCGIYLGNNEFISCQASFEDGVTIKPLTGKYNDELIAVRRYLPETVTSANTSRTVTGSYRSYKLYAKKDTGSTILTTISKGESVTVLFVDTAGWAYVRTASDCTGFLRSEYIS